jgi:hypothetical protein
MEECKNPILMEKGLRECSFFFDSSSDPPRLLIDDDYQKMIDELYEHSEIEVIAINIKDLPDDIFQRYLKLRE